MNNDKLLTDKDFEELTKILPEETNEKIYSREDLDDIDQAAIKQGRQVIYEYELLFELLDIHVQSQEEGEEILKELTGERLFLSSAVALTREEKLTIAKQFMRITGFAIRSITTIINPDLIIGVRLQSERFYYEYSGAQILHTIQNQLISTRNDEVISS